MAAEGRMMKRKMMEGIGHDILVRLPAKSLVRFKCVSKGWRSLISSHDFAKQNLNHIKSNVHRIILSSLDSILSIEYDPTCGNGNNIAVERRVERLSFPFTSSDFNTTSDMMTPKVLGSCNGLLCLAIHIQRGWRSEDSILFWNPCIGEEFKVPPVLGPRWDNFAQHVCGFGYDKCGDDYKVVSIGYSPLLVAFYSLKAKTWRMISLPPDSALLTRKDIADDGSNSKGGTFVDGMVYWISSTRDRLIGFNVEDEKFESVEAPKRMHLKAWKIARLGVCSESEGSCLLVITSHFGNIREDGILDVWKLKLRPKADDDDNKWTKFATITSSPKRLCSTIVSLCFGKVLVVCPARFDCCSSCCSKCKTGNYTFWVYDPKTGAFQHQVCDLTLPVPGYQYQFPTPYEQGIIHVHSLVSPTSY